MSAAATAVWMCPECGHGSADPRDERAHLDAHRQLRAFFVEWEAGTEAPAGGGSRRSRWLVRLGVVAAVLAMLLVSSSVYSQINRAPDPGRAQDVPADVRPADPTGAPPPAAPPAAAVTPAPSATPAPAAATPAPAPATPTPATAPGASASPRAAAAVPAATSATPSTAAAPTTTVPPTSPPAEATTPEPAAPAYLLSLCLPGICLHVL